MRLCRPDIKLVEHYACCGIFLIGATYLSPVTKLVAGISIVSLYQLFRSRKFITVKDYNCGKMRVSGCNYHFESFLAAGAKQELVTSLLIITPVLAVRHFLSICWFVCPRTILAEVIRNVVSFSNAPVHKCMEILSSLHSS